MPPTSPVSLGLISGGSVVPSGLETFCSQVGGHIHNRHTIMERFRLKGTLKIHVCVSPKNDGAVAIPAVRSEPPSLKQAVPLEEEEGKGGRELKLFPLRSHLRVLDRSSYFVAGNKRAGCTAKIPCKEKKKKKKITACSRWSRSSPYRFSVALGKHSKERATGNVDGSW